MLTVRAGEPVSDPMSALRFILGDQLTRSIPTLNGLDPTADIVLMVEVAEETTYVPHHKQKIAFILSAMRHFGDELRAEGITVDYVRLDDPDNTGSFTGELERAARRHLPTRSSSPSRASIASWTRSTAGAAR